MKKISIIISILSVVLLSSCDVKTSGFDKFYGMWHLTEIDSLSTGKSYYLGDDRYFWMFEANLMELRNYDTKAEMLLMRYNHVGDTLIVSEPYFFDRLNDDRPLDDISYLKPYGIHQLTDTFIIRQLSGSKMTVESRKVRIGFKKY